MTEASHPTGADSAEYIAHEEFRNGLPYGRFRVVVNPDLARRYVAHRVHATAVALALVGPGVASALAGYLWLGAFLVAAGILFRRSIKWQAPKILLWLATRQSEIYYEATQHGVMEVKRSN